MTEINQNTLPAVVSGEFIVGMPEEEYHEHPALSASGMKALLRSPKHFRASRSLNKARPEFDFGHGVHSIVLGVGAEIVQVPDHLLSADGGVRSNAAKAWKAEAIDEGKTVLKGSDFLHVTAGARAVLSNVKARRCLEAAPYREVSLFATDPTTGVAQRGRVDALGSLLVDLKTANDISDRGVTRAVVDHGYYLSAAVYRHLLTLILGEDPGPMHLIFVEKEAPYDVVVKVLDDPDWHALGMKRMRQALETYARCVEFGVWPGADDETEEVQSLEFPGWLRSQIEMEVQL